MAGTLQSCSGVAQLAGRNIAQNSNRSTTLTAKTTVFVNSRAFPRWNDKYVVACSARDCQASKSGYGFQNELHVATERVMKPFAWLEPAARGKRGSSPIQAVSPAVESGGSDGGNVGGIGDGGGGQGGGGDGEGAGEESSQDKNRTEAFAALSVLGRSLESVPADLGLAIQEGRIPALIVQRFADLERNGIFRWLLGFGGFKERLLADDLFLTKVGIECGVGIFTKSAAEWEKRKENFWKEFDFVVADVIMALIADFMLVWLPAPTVALRPGMSKQANALARFFYSCPDNAFQVALRGSSFTMLQRVGAIVRNGGKLFGVGTCASLVGTAATNGLITVRKAMDKNFKAEEKGSEVEVPILQTTAAYGVYMSISSNLRYQIVAGVIEQRMLEPWLHSHKLALSLLCFVVRTGNTFLGSLMWVDYARFVGVQ
eukprot:TRINITY_DN23532_c0_g1_i1.p1 TRINITY_DN23532_c0_g1~~TRINITY_DN23532_c0_g1_i1.p1  ORF type:complete len:430 (+),score=77.22 TRINITY_DN23532_c0_g1_i1:195-1484(+)